MDLPLSFTPLCFSIIVADGVKRMTNHGPLLSYRTARTLAIVAIAGACLALQSTPLAAQQNAIPLAPSAQVAPVPPDTTYKNTSTVDEHAHSETLHHYSSEATRANDAMLIAAVKSALANDGVIAGHAVVVDCDHSKVTLAGAVGSKSDAQHAVQVASAVTGVTAVKSKLTW